METVKTIRKDNHVLRIYIDDNAQDPRNNNPYSMMKIEHDGYALGDKPETSPSEYLNWLFNAEFGDKPAYTKLLKSIKKSGKLRFDRSKGEWYMPIRYSTMFSGPDDGRSVICGKGELECYIYSHEITDNLTDREKMKVLEEFGHLFVLLSINESDGVLSLKEDNTDGHGSGVCGYCVIEIDEIPPADSETDSDRRSRAYEMISTEINEYAAYLRGDTYAYDIYEVSEGDSGSMTDEEIMESGTRVVTGSNYYGEDGIKEITGFLDALK